MPRFTILISYLYPIDRMRISCTGCMRHRTGAAAECLLSFFGLLLYMVEVCKVSEKNKSFWLVSEPFRHTGAAADCPLNLTSNLLYIF
jgi:hypothetical protein